MTYLDQLKPVLNVQNQPVDPEDIPSIKVAQTEAVSCQGSDATDIRSSVCDGGVCASLVGKHCSILGWELDIH